MVLMSPLPILGMRTTQVYCTGSIKHVVIVVARMPLYSFLPFETYSTCKSTNVSREHSNFFEFQESFEFTDFEKSRVK